MKVYLQRDDSLSALTVAISCCFLVLFASGYETDRKKMPSKDKLRPQRLSLDSVRPQLG